MNLPVGGATASTNDVGIMPGIHDIGLMSCPEFKLNKKIKKSDLG